MKIRRLLIYICSMLFDDKTQQLDHAPISGPVNKRRAAKRIKQAERDHGKNFITAVPVERKTPPSHLLQELDRKSAAVKAKPSATGSVTPLRRQS